MVARRGRLGASTAMDPELLEPSTPNWFGGLCSRPGRLSTLLAPAGTSPAWEIVNVRTGKDRPGGLLTGRIREANRKGPELRTDLGGGRALNLHEQDGGISSVVLPLENVPSPSGPGEFDEIDIPQVQTCHVKSAGQFRGSDFTHDSCAATADVWCRHAFLRLLPRVPFCDARRRIGCEPA
jgi:hypothetical protein